ncbi:hypothetical protein [Enterococcus faecium]
METSMLNIPIYVDKEKLLEKPVTKKERECKIFCVNEKIHTKKEVASVE